MIAVVACLLIVLVAILVHRDRRTRTEIRFLRSELDLIGRKAWEPSTYRTYARDALDASNRRLP